MPNPSPDFAPDLEWMLQSGQVSKELLLEALVYEYYAPVFRLAYATLDDQSAAQSAANQTFSSALVELYRYRAQEGVETWLYRIALEACSKAQASLKARRTILSSIPFLYDPEILGDSLPDTELDSEIWLAVDGLKNGLRQVVLLHFVLGWQAAEIAALNGETEEALKSELEQAQAALLEGPIASRLLRSHERPFSPTEAAALLKNSLEKRWPFPDFTQLELDRKISRISRQAGRIGTRRRGIVAFMEIGVIAFIILVGAGIAWGMNLIGEAQTTATPTMRLQNTVLVTKIVYQYITATPEPAQSNLSPTTTPFRLQTNQYVYARLGESLEDLAQRLGTSSEALRELNRIPSTTNLEPGQRLLLPEQWDNLVFPRPTPVPSVVPGPTLGEPYIAEMVVQRFAVQGPRYNTLWLDALVIDYGPLSYIGPARIYRSQLWESREQSLVLIGYPDQPPQEVILRLGRNGYLARPADDSPWFSEWQSIFNYASPSMQDMQRMAQSLFDTRDVERSDHITVFGREELAGQQALVLDIFDHEGLRTDRIWYDDSRGLILRRIVYMPGEPSEPVFEVKLLDIAYDIELPQGLFDTRIPWRGAYAEDSSGLPANLEDSQISLSTKRAPKQIELPPPDFNPARSRLAFQFPPSFPIHSPAQRIQLFGDQYHLGEVLFGNPWETICQRSPDGSWMAFVSRPVNESDSDSALRWFHLSNPEKSFRTLSTQLGVTGFAFSPDNTRLAYFARPSSRGMGTLGVVDLETGQDQPLLIIGDVNSLVWDPEGKYLAMIARYDSGSYLENVSVIDVDHQKITYNASIDVLSNAVGDWPMLDWGVEFPVEMNRMDECALPPSS